MDVAALKEFFESNGVGLVDGKKTVLRSFSEITPDQLTRQANRLNSGWIRSQYLIINSPQSVPERNVILENWESIKKKNNIWSDQFLLINVREGDSDDWEWYNAEGKLIGHFKELQESIARRHLDVKTKYSQYLAAMRTKPFLILAGFSGTGKSQIVKEMAFASCPASLQNDKSTPGNYCMIEVKPNWHDSSDLIGYVSSVPHRCYVVTPFINFLVKALNYPEVPFFICLDEMNLAPVEQYFAEFLSVLESRKYIDGKIISQPLIKSDYTKPYINDFIEAFYGESTETDSIFKDIAENGLRLPSNVIVVGTVNMDETTYQFSRKVIDRAMTIEMNKVNYDSIFDTEEDPLNYPTSVLPSDYFLSKYTRAQDALKTLNDEDRKHLKENIPDKLEKLDEILFNTPFRIAYRVENELVLYFATLREEYKENTAQDLLTKAIDEIMMMKVLPRIEGNEDVLSDPLKNMLDFVKDYPKARAKVEEMKNRLEINHFTSFWP